jgi:hypothetical protein
MTAWPSVKAALVGLVPSLSGWSSVAVYSGPVVTGDAPTEFFTVGYVPGEDFGGIYEQARGPGDLPVEEGTVRSELVCSSGSARDMPMVEARAFALVDALQAAVDRDPTLGVLRQGSTVALAVDVQPQQLTSGAVQRLAVTLTYSALV